MKIIAITIDVEQDCPPFLATMKGIEEGMPKLLNLFKHYQITPTFFTTGQIAQLYPDIISQIPKNGYELGCHGYLHERFDKIDINEANYAITTSKKILENFGTSVTSFRAPNLQFPEKYLKILEKNDFNLDSSEASYKYPFNKKTYQTGNIVRIPTSITSSVLRLPLGIILPMIERMHNSVLFVHPWEFVDMSKSSIRWDCKFRTGKKALDNLASIIEHFKNKNYEFVTMKQMGANFLQNNFNEK